MDPWAADRPGDFADRDGQPDVDAGRVGAPGPDQGYALKLVGVLRDDLQVSAGEDRRDAETAIVAIACKRAALFGRAPAIHDLRIAATVWGLLDAAAPSELVAERTKRFEAIRHTAHHYPELRAVVDAVPADTLRRTPAEVTEAHARDWRSLLSL
jgi:hypothetical protein